MYLKQDTFRINAGWGQASPPPQSISFAVKLCKAKCSDRQGLASSTSHHSLSTLGLLLLQKSTRKWTYINQSSYKERDLIKKNRPRSQFKNRFSSHFHGLDPIWVSLLLLQTHVTFYDVKDQLYFL